MHVNFKFALIITFEEPSITILSILIEQTFLIEIHFKKTNTNRKFYTPINELT